LSVRSRLALTVLCFVLGIGLVAQMRGRRAQSSLANVPSRDQSTILGGLVVANADLRSEVQKLEGEIQAYTKASERAGLAQMIEELDRMRIVNGRVEVTGAGVEVQIGAGVSVMELQDVLNEVRNAGAEAVCLNGVRLVTNSAVSAQGTRVAVDGKAISPPFVFQAIGDPGTMATALNRHGGQLEYLRVFYPGLEVTVETVPLMVLPAAHTPRTFVLAQPLE
jgi:uncharacterized protein YlxW (UPF0749 family)